VGEFGLIDRLVRQVQDPSLDPLKPSPDGEIRVGDDAAVWRSQRGGWDLFTTDALVEGVHFKLATTGWRDLGWKALTENLSDVAAMGGTPRRAFVTLGLRPETLVSDLEALYQGMREAADEFGVAIVGGDTVASPITLISVGVQGELEGSGLRRACGRAGDVVAVTGALGGSAGGLELLELGVVDPLDAEERALVERHRRPWPRVREGLALAKAGVRCGMDLSDGLLGDAAKLAHASGVGLTIAYDMVPVEAALTSRFGDRARPMALAGGEDYELLFAAPAPVIEASTAALADAGLTSLSSIGQLTAEKPGQVRVVDAAGREVRVGRGSWEHFAGGTDRRDS